MSVPVTWNGLLTAGRERMSAYAGGGPTENATDIADNQLLTMTGPQLLALAASHPILFDRVAPVTTGSTAPADLVRSNARELLVAAYVESWRAVR